LTAGQDPATLEPGHYFGYPVDSGTGGFMDEVAARRLATAYESGPGAAEAMLAELERTYTHTWSWADIPLDARTGANAVVFSTGVGDGMYPSYVGRDGTGRPVRLLTDFNLVAPLPPDADAELAKRPRPWWEFWR